MMKLFLLSVLLSTAALCMAATLGVSLDGSQPFSSIQMAVDASAHGDTVLVYPGRYIENVDYNGKNITIASLEITTGNPAYRDSTIIDGNQNGSTIKSTLSVNNATIYGLTIVHGTGTYFIEELGFPVYTGGGIWIRNADQFRIFQCVIKDNQANWGGGVAVKSSTLHMSGCVLHDNYATGGGGLYILQFGQVLFDSTNRCSIYNNNAGYAQDIMSADARIESSVFLDKGTICPTSNYYIYYTKLSPDVPGGFTQIDIIRGHRAEINHDIFVSPSGNDTNDGISINTPIKSILKAMQIVASDSLNPKSVHLASGVYSTNDGQFFPINTKPYVILVGDSLHYPVLENLIYSYTIMIGVGNNQRISNIEIEYGNNDAGSMSISGSWINDVLIKNIRINPHAELTSGCLLFGTNNYYPASYTLENISISGQNSNSQCRYYNNMPDAVVENLTIDSCHNTGDEFDGPMSTFYFYGNKLTLENSKIINNTMAYDETPVVSIGMRGADSDSRLIMNNVLIANNQSGGYTPVFIAAFTDSTSVISNCTFANNSGGSIANILNGNLRVANCIFDNDTQMEILCQGTYPNTVSHVSFENNFIRGYPNTFSSSAVNEISFNDVVLTGNPGFCSSQADDPLSYRLSNTSICRDAGTPDTTGLYLPEYDLYGNPRVYGTAIDLGCNEWSYPVAIDDQLVPPALPVSIYPNPFMGETSIRYHLDKACPVNLKVYNLRGQLVRTLYTGTQGKGEQHLAWEGCDDRGRPVASGIYFLQLSLEGKAMQAVKMVKW